MRIEDKHDADQDEDTGKEETVQFNRRIIILEGIYAADCDQDDPDRTAEITPEAYENTEGYEEAVPVEQPPG